MNNTELHKLQKEEAIKRMEILKISQNTIKEFEKEELVNYSERLSKEFDGILYWVSNEPELVKIINQFQEEHNYLVYHCQLTHFEFGSCLSLLYVSDEPGEWESEKEELKSGYAFAYVENLDDPLCSEFGTIGIQPCNGGVKRTC